MNKFSGSEDVFNEWYSQQPQGVLLRAKDTAEIRLKGYSNEIVGEIMKNEHKSIEDSIIINEISEIKNSGHSLVLTWREVLQVLFCLAYYL